MYNSTRRRLMMGQNTATPILPVGYTQVNYIESTGTQCFSTGVYPTDKTTFFIDYAYLGTAVQTNRDWFAIYGSRGTTASQYFCLFTSKAGFNGIGNDKTFLTVNYAGFDPGTNAEAIINVSERYKVLQDRGDLYINGVFSSVLSTSNSFSNGTTAPIYLFAHYQTGSVDFRGIKLKVWGCYVEENGVRIRNYIPCYRNADLKVGLYDTINDVFYYNTYNNTNFLYG